MSAAIRFFPAVFFGVYGLAAAFMAVSDVFFSAQVASGTSFGPAPGWLREIACFNVFLVFMCAASLRQIGTTTLPRTCALGLTVLSLLIGSNNVAAYLSSHAPFHLQGSIVHFVSAAGGVTTIWLLGMRQPGGTTSR